MTSPYHALIIDMDGVLWRGPEPAPGLVEFFALLRRQSIRFVLMTNNSTATPAQYLRKLASFGVEVSTDEILTSSEGTAAYLAEIAPAGGRVFAIGEDGVREALRARGFTLVGLEAQAADFVVVGWDRGLTWNTLRQACLLIRRGARFVGTNPDRTFPMPEGLVPGNGAQLAFLEAATGVAPVVVGKPEPILYEQAWLRLGADKTRTAVIGDRLETDILGGRRAGLRTILVLSGVATAADLAVSEWKPDEVYGDIGMIARAWAGAA